MKWHFANFSHKTRHSLYSIKWAVKSNQILINEPRFKPVGILTLESKANLAYILSWSSAKGTTTIVEFPDILYRGWSKQKIKNIFLIITL